MRENAGQRRLQRPRPGLGGILPGEQTHVWGVTIGLGINNLGCGVAGDGKVRLVLHHGIKILGNVCLRVIIHNAFCEDIGYLLVDTAFTGPDEANPLQ